MQLCEAFGLPLLSLSDTPGIMVGPEVEKTGLVAHAARMFLAGAIFPCRSSRSCCAKAMGWGPSP